MCFGAKAAPQQTPLAPAPAPAPPEQPAEAQDPVSPRKAEDKELFGTSTPDLRVDRSVSSGGVGSGGTGIRMM